MNRISILFLLLSISLKAQTYQLGLPRVTNFTEDDYKAAVQNWDVVSDRKGHMYFGNNYGLLHYNGKSWQLCLQPENRTIIRSLEITRNDTIFIGAQGDFGYRSTDYLGRQSYVSLTSMIPEEFRSFEDVWSILKGNGIIYFQTTKAIYCYNGEKITVLKAKNEFTYAANHPNKILVYDKGHGLYHLNNGKLQLAEGGEKLSKLNIKFIMNMPADQQLIGTVYSGFYLFDGTNLRPWKSEVSKLTNSTIPYVCIALSDGSFAMGTAGNGLIVFDKDGKVIQQLDTKTGLGNNIVTNIYEDRYDNLWVTLDNGISYVERNSNFYFLDKKIGLGGAAHAFLNYKKKLYVGTNEGLFVTDLEGAFQGHKVFRKIKGSSGQIWNLDVKDETIWVGHHLGAFVLENDKMKPINTGELGAWGFVHPPGREDLILQGTYSGLDLLVKENGSWRLKKKIVGYDHTAREMAFDKEGMLWICHGYKGVFCLKLNEDFDTIENLKLYDQEHGLPSNLFTNLFKLDDQVVFGTEQGVYQFDPIGDRMVPNQYYNNLLGTDNLVRRLFQTPERNILYILGYDNSDHIGILNVQSQENEKRSETPFQMLRGDLIPAFEAIHWLNERDFLIGSKDGALLYRGSHTRNYQFQFNTTIGKVYCSVMKDTVLFGANDLPATDQDGQVTQTLPYEMNGLRFDYSATFYERPSFTQFQTKLEGIDEQWSHWTTNTSVSYTNLHEGNYNFRVRSKNIYGIQGVEDYFAFVINPPWYRTFEFLSFAGLFFMGTVLLLLWSAKKKYKDKVTSREQKKVGELLALHSRHQNEKLEIENEIYRLKTQKLQDDISYKSKELASSTMHLLQQNETILGIQSEIRKIACQAKEEVKSKLDHVAGSIDDILQSDQNWDHFELYFNEVHNNFIKRLKNEYPELTARELRLCAYLRMNLSTKEIAPLMGISNRGIEGLRYRVRKKMNLDGQEGLTEYMVKY